MNILFIHPVNIDYPGGAERFVVEVSQRLRLRGYSVGVLQVNWAPHKPVTMQNSLELLRLGIELHKCGYLKLPRGFPVFNPSCILQISRQYDLLYMSAYSPNELVIYSLKKIGILNKPVIAVFHTMLEPHRDILHRLYLPLFIAAYKVFEKLHVLNKYTYDFFVKYHGIDERKVIFIPNGVDISRYYIKHRHSYFQILWTGRLTFDKGADTLCKVVDTFNRRYPHLINNVRFVITGSGTKVLEEYIKRLSQRYDNVEYLGYVDQVTLRELYATSHLYLITSRSEGMPLRVLEAMASGLPIAGSDIPGIHDLIINRHIGKSVRMGDIYGFCKAIEGFYNQWKNEPERYYGIRQTIRALTIANFSWEVIVNKIEKMFREILLESD